MAFTETNNEVKQAQQVKVGDKVPTDFEFLILDEGASDPRPVSLSKLVSGKKAVLFGLPGAFTSVCSSKHVPEYNKKKAELQQEGVDVVACLSVNDPWVMREWAKSLNVDPSNICMLADGEGKWHQQVGLLQHMPGLGMRSLRYSMLVEDGVVKILNIEESGGKSYKYSGPDGMLRCIREGATDLKSLNV
eukprot:jgi/Chrzof1/14123/Cz08g25270.t1